MQYTLNINELQRKQYQDTYQVASAYLNAFPNHNLVKKEFTNTFMDIKKSINSDYAQHMAPHFMGIGWYHLKNYKLILLTIRLHTE